MIAGSADFLAKPVLGIKAGIELERVEVDYFEPIVRRYGFTVRRGMLDAGGTFEYAPGINVVDLQSVAVGDAVIDYLYGVGSDQAIDEVTRTAQEVMNDPERLFRVRRLVMKDGTVGFVNRLTRPNYRVYVSNADFELSNLSSRIEDGVARASLTGSFMGTGRVRARASFVPEGKSPNFEAKLEIRETQMKPLNDLLRAYANLDVDGGVFSFYSEVQVKDGYVQGYVKPLFRDVDVYDPRQDRKKNIFRKMYEGMAELAATILENRRRGEVATVARISGPVENPNSSTLQVIAGLIRNAFFKAILPGLDNEFSRAAPRLNRQARRAQRREQAAGDAG